MFLLSKKNLALALLSTQFCAYAWAADPAAGIARITDGMPALATTALDATSYEPQIAKRLKNAQLLYVNYELLTQMLIDEGVKIPPGGITDAMKKEFADHVSYIIPSQLDSPDDFLDIAKTFYADRYGGLGLNGNHGSGRAMSAGKVQIKGGGGTNLRAKGGHWNGATNTIEIIDEATWGEVLHHELPHSANRTIAIVDTGTNIAQGDYTLMRATAVRYDPLRPAQFMRNPATTKEFPKLENKRVANVLSHLADALPQKPGAKFASEGEKLKAGFINFMDNVAEQYSTAWAKSFYHGATSPSNILINGAMIDFGTQTAMSGYQRIQQIIEDEERPSGDTMTQKTELFHNMIDNFHENLPENLKKYIPTKEWADNYYDKTYRRAMDRQMLRLTGMPTEFIEAVAETPEGMKLGRMIEKLAKVGNEELPIGEQPVGDPGKYHLGRLLGDAAGSPGKKSAELSLALQKEIPDGRVRLAFADAYAKVQKLVETKAGAAGLSPEALHTYINQAVAVRNKKTPDLITYNALAKDYDQPMWDMVKKARETRDPSPVQNFIDQRVQRNRRTFFDAKPFEVVLSEKVDPRSQVRTRKIFDAKTNKFLTVTESNIPGLAIPAKTVKTPAPELHEPCPVSYGRL